MEGSVGVVAGGIAGLVGVLREHGEAVEFDLLCNGLRLDWLGTDRLTWHDLAVFIRWCRPDSAVNRSLSEHWQRTPELDMWRSIEHSLRVLTWQIGGGRAYDYPQPIPLPWDEPLADKPDSMDWDDGMAWLGWVDLTT